VLSIIAASVVTTIEMLLAGAVPPTAVPAIVRVSPTAYPLPLFTIEIVYDVEDGPLVTLKVAPEPEPPVAPTTTVTSETIATAVPEWVKVLIGPKEQYKPVPE
jgi:hypothetical protein